MWPLSAQAQNQLGQTHTVNVRITAYTSAFGIIPNIRVVGGSVTVDATSQTRRSATVEIGQAEYWPADDPAAILSPLGSELLVEYGIVLSSTLTEWVPLIRGPITEIGRRQPWSGDAALSVTVADRSQKVAEAKFDQPAQTVVGATHVAEITRLITEVLPEVTVTDLTGSVQVAAQLDMDKERWADGVEKLADAIAAECFANPVGEFIIRPQPTVDDGHVWGISAGDGGVLLSIDERKTRELTYNKIVASGQRTDGTPPVWAAVSDNDPTSPTYIGGPFGTKTRFHSSPLLTTVGQCTTAAQGLLARAKGMHGTVELSMAVNPALDAGDVVWVHTDDGTRSHIIDTITIPLSPKDEQQITTRSIELPPEYA